MTTEAMTLIPRRIETDADVQVMRELRNEGREGFAHDQSYIQEERQRLWWATNKRHMLGWLYSVLVTSVLPDDGSQIKATMGYGLLRQTLDDGRWWSSVAVAPWARGHGYGTQIMRHLVGEAPGRVWAEVLEHNTASLRMHEPSRWEEVGLENGVYLLRTRGYGL